MAKPQEVVRRITYPMQMIISIPIIAAGIWIGNSCVDFGLQKAIIGLGLVVFFFGCIGCCGFCGKSKGLLLIYFRGMFCLLLCMLGYIIFLSVITRYSSSSSADPNHRGGAAYKEYHLDHFSFWYRRKLSRPSFDWNLVLTCLAPSNWCARLDETYHSYQQLFTAHLTPLQYGCCMPPPKCGYTFVSPTVWTSSTSTNNNQTNADCANWSNDPRELCHFCDSCIAGLLATTTKRLETTNLILLVTFVLSIIIYVVFYCIFCYRSREYT